MFQCFGGKFIIGSILRAVNDIFLFLSPLILRKLLSVMENDEDVTRGYFWCVMLLLTAAAQAVISAQYFRFMFQTGLQRRAAVMRRISTAQGDWPVLLEARRAVCRFTLLSSLKS
mgnify:CR=1 FL=1